MVGKSILSPVFLPRRWAGRVLACLLALALLFSSASAERVFIPVNEENARAKALSLFLQCAFHPEYSSSQPLTRWEQEITLWVGGSFTREDLETLDGFLRELAERVPGLPAVRRVRRDTDAAVRVWFVPQRMLGAYIEGYVEDNWGFFHYTHSRGRITSARVGIASDCTEQEERNHLILEELVGALGLPGDHNIYADSILYNSWTTVQSLSDVDWRMLRMLYDPALTPGMTEAEAGDRLRELYSIPR